VRPDGGKDNRSRGTYLGLRGETLCIFHQSLAHTVVEFDWVGSLHLRRLHVLLPAGVVVLLLLQRLALRCGALGSRRRLVSSAVRAGEVLVGRHAVGPAAQLLRPLELSTS
jgi:hypothetical protein